MGTKLLFIRVEEYLFDKRRWDTAHVNEHRKLLNLWIDKGYDVCLVSTMDVSKILEIQKNMYIADSGYLIGSDGGEIYDIRKKKEIISKTFSTKDLTLVERLVERIDFDNMNTGLITFWRTGDNRAFLNNGSDLFRTKTSELESKNIVVNTLIHFPLDDGSINRITVKFPNKINTNETIELLNRLAPNFNFISNEDDTIELLPGDSTIKNAVDYLCAKDKSFAKIIADKEVISIGYTKSDISLFDISKESYTLVSCPFEISKKATKTFMGEISSIVSFTLKEILKTQ